jgi:adenosylcobinamide-GDP ribazoletransferase
MMYGHRYAREEGLGNLFIGKVTFTQTVITLALALLVAVGLEGTRV